MRAAAVEAGRFAGWRMVGIFAITQTVGYGTLYYAYAVLLAPMERDLHASRTAVAGALTAGVLAGAAAAVPVGRWLDRHGGRGLMTAGSIAATLLLLAWSQITSIAGLYAVQIGIGLCTAAVFYEAAFAVVVTWFADHRRGSALLAVTAVAGFAASVFLPLTGLLTERYGWRTAILVLTGIHAVTIPLHLAVRRPAASVPDPVASSKAALANAARDPAYWLLVGVFVVHAAAIATVAVHLVAYLTEAGHPGTFAATVAGLLGVLSVTGRLVTTAAARRWTVATVVAVVFTVQAAGALALLIAGRLTTGAIAGVLAVGLGFGVASIARPQLLADRYGTIGYATIAGLMAVPLTVTKALAPLGAAAVHDAAGSYTPVLIAVAATCLLSAGGLLMSRPAREPDTYLDR